MHQSVASSRSRGSVSPREAVNRMRGSGSIAWDAWRLVHPATQLGPQAPDEVQGMFLQLLAKARHPRPPPRTPPGGPRAPVGNPPKDRGSSTNGQPPAAPPEWA